MHFGECLDEERYLAAIRHAYNKGIRTFMTADVYGNGEADRMLGLALEGLPRDSYCLVGTIGHDFYEGQRSGAKGYPRFTDPSLRGPRDYAAFLRMACEKSLERCRAARFDLLLLHNPDGIGYSSQDVWGGMAALRDAGLTSLLGVAPGPANGFTLDIIGCFETFAGVIDWAMIILSPFEPWPGSLCLPAAERNEVKIITRVVDHGGVFHDDVRPGHVFPEKDHRTFRPAGWVELGCEKLGKMRPVAERHGLTMLQLACQWNLAQPAVRSVVPTLIQESKENPWARSILEKIDDLAALPAQIRLSPGECRALAAIGDNKGCMALKGGTPAFDGEGYVADAWPVSEELAAIGRRWGIRPENDLVLTH